MAFGSSLPLRTGPDAGFSFTCVAPACACAPLVGWVATVPGFFRDGPRATVVPQPRSPPLPGNSARSDLMSHVTCTTIQLILWVNIGEKPEDGQRLLAS